MKTKLHVKLINDAFCFWIRYSELHMLLVVFSLISSSASIVPGYVTSIEWLLVFDQDTVLMGWFSTSSIWKSLRYRFWRHFRVLCFSFCEVYSIPHFVFLLYESFETANKEANDPVRYLWSLKAKWTPNEELYSSCRYKVIATAGLGHCTGRGWPETPDQAFWFEL